MVTGAGAAVTGGVVTTGALDDCVGADLDAGADVVAGAIDPTEPAETGAAPAVAGTVDGSTGTPSTVTMG